LKTTKKTFKIKKFLAEIAKNKGSIERRYWHFERRIEKEGQREEMADEEGEKRGWEISFQLGRNAW